MNVTDKMISIMAGWSKLLFRDPDVERVAIPRAEKCARCDNANDSNWCAICNCYIPAKVRSLKEKCPIDEW